MAGIDPYPDSEKKDLVDLLLNSLKLIQAGNSPEEKTAAIILETVLLHPLHFPSQLLNQENNEYEVLKFFTESIFNPVDELRKNAQPPKILQTQEASFIPLIKKQHEPKISERNIEKCVHSLTLSEPFFPNPKLYVQKKELPLENNGLLEIFNISTPDSVAKRYLESLKNKLEEFTPLLTTYKVTSFDKLNELKQNLLAAFHQSQTTLAEKQYSIELLANKLMPDPVDKALKDTRLIGHLDSPIELKEALIFFLKRDMELYHKRNPALSQEDIYALNRNIQEYLIHATHQQHIERLINQIEGLKEGDDPEDMALSLSSKREYNIADHPEYLLIEYFSKILLRKDQVESLDLLAIKDGKIGNKASFGAAMELIMGSGKTAFIGPLLSYLNADGNSLACFIMPDALLPSMASEMQTTLGNAFAQKLEVLTFSRSTKIDQIV